ncbi:polysaccharide deacetylase family protein [Streptomyces sp. NPDC048331]|uniref:polysaccharide deacetylase family protein n=1 Tax=Streptomyces sp. NPDC048331 TaxID=3365534 RepID=UPI003717A7DC
MNAVHSNVWRNVTWSVSSSALVAVEEEVHARRGRQDAGVCRAGERLRAAFGREPKSLRPPYGAVDDEVRLAAKACGVTALITWTRDFTTWGETPPTPRLRAGGIVLLHVTPMPAADLQRALDAARAAGLQSAALMPRLRAAGMFQGCLRGRGGPWCSRPGRGGGPPGGRC